MLSKQWLAPCILVKVTEDVSRFPGNAFRKTCIDLDLHAALLFLAKFSRGWSLFFQTMLMSNNPVAPIRQGTWQQRVGENRDISFDGKHVRKLYCPGCLILFPSSWFHLFPRHCFAMKLEWATGWLWHTVELWIISAPALQWTLCRCKSLSALPG